MTVKDFSYKFCKDNQLLPEVSSDSILIFHTDDCDINAIAHIQSKFKLPRKFWWLMGIGGLIITALGPISIWKTMTGIGWTWKGRYLK